MTFPVRLQPPPGVLDIAARLERDGYEAWCVGGAVRDALLGHPSLDWDLATAAPPRVVQQLFRRTVPKGIEFGTVGVFDVAGVLHEVTTFRRDVHTDGRHAVVEFGASLVDDLARRDFTINAIAYRPATGEVADPFDGAGDAERRVVRAVGDPPARMHEDRLRALRGIRFAARFGFEIAPATWAAIVESAPFLGRLSPERVHEELEKTMQQVRCSSDALLRWRDAGALAALIPALAEQSTVALSTADYLAVPALRGRPQRLPNRLAASWLGIPRGEVERGLRALRASNHEVRWTADVTDRAGRLIETARAALLAGTGPSDAELRVWAAACGRTLAAPSWRLIAARFAAERADAVGGERATPAPERVRSVYRRLVRIAYRDPIVIGDLAISGSDLAEVGIAAGPAVGATLRRLLDEVVADPARNTRGWLLARAADLARDV